MFLFSILEDVNKRTKVWSLCGCWRGWLDIPWSCLSCRPMQRVALIWGACAWVMLECTGYEPANSDLSASMEV